MQYGDIEQLSIDGRIFGVASGSDVAIELGGTISEVTVDGQGNSLVKVTKIPWMLESVPLITNPLRGDIEFLKSKTRPNGDKDYTIMAKLVDGTRFQGRGLVTGEVKFQTGTGQTPVTLSGGNKLTRQ